MPGVVEEPPTKYFSTRPLNLRDAAAYLGIAAETYHKLQNVGIFPLTELNAERLDRKRSLSPTALTA